ncbi:hypothetical protein EV183_002593 [Coemansia sp. RSA 2336]|nr:hypothetical protein EV183_002593 [Coemansia sp. RSA 2336]
MANKSSAQSTPPTTAADTASQSLLSMLGDLSSTAGLSSVSATNSSGDNNSGSTGATGLTTAAPISSDIDQLMRSLSDSVDTSKVSDDELNKLLGSINADFSSNLALPSTQANASENDPLAALGRDLGIDFKSMGSTAPGVAGNITTRALETADVPTSSAFSPAVPSASGGLSLPTNALLGLQSLGNSSSEIGASRAQSVGGYTSTLSGQPGTPGSLHGSGSTTPFSGSIEQPADASAAHSARSATGPQQQAYRPSTPRPQTMSNTSSPAPRSSSMPQRQQQQQQQRPPQGNRPPSKPRPPFSGQNIQQQPGSSSAQTRPAAQQMSARPAGQNNAGARPPVRPQPRPIGESTDPSKWLAATMSTLPPDQQERLAELFRGLQSKAVDFPTFMKDAEAIMGSKFQDMLALMRNQGTRGVSGVPTPQQQQHQQQQQRMQKPNRPPGTPVGQQQQSPSLHRPHPVGGGLGQRPGTSHSPSATPSSMASNTLPTQNLMNVPVPDANRNLALARQSLGQSGQAFSSEQFAGMSDLASLISSGSLSHSDAGGSSASASGQNSFEMVISRWRQIILNPAITNDQLAKLNMQLNAFGNLLTNPMGNMANVSEDERGQQLAQITKLQSLITHRQLMRGPGLQVPQPDSRPESPSADNKGKDPKRKGALSMPKPKKRPADPRRQSSPVPRIGIKKQRTDMDMSSEPDLDMFSNQAGLAGTSLSLNSNPSMGGAGGNRHLSGNYGLSAAQDEARGRQNAYMDVDDPMDFSVARNAISRTSTTGTSGHQSDTDDGARPGERGRGIDPMRDRMTARDAQRRLKEKHARERSSSAIGGDIFSIDDVIGYTGVDLREESEMISGMHYDTSRRLPGGYGAMYDGPRHSTVKINGVEVARDRAMRAKFANPVLLEAIVAKVCRGLHMRAVTADVIPYLSYALQERLRSFMELVSAAAHHRARTQTLPPPPLDPVTRLPLYKITPHLDVKKQLIVIEHVDKLREQTRQQRLLEREQRNTMEHSPQHDGDGVQASASDENQRSQLAGEGGAGTKGSDNARKPGEVAGADSSEQSRGSKRGRKKDDANESPAYTSKNMPEELQNKISNLTALRAAGGVRKAWMTAGSADWASGGLSGKQSQRITAAATAPPQTPGSDASDMGGGGQQSLRTPRRTASIASNTVAGGSGTPVALSSTSHPPPSHSRARSSFGAGSDYDGSALATPTSEGLSPTPYGTLRPQSALLPHRSTTLTTPLLVTVRDCLFSLERERLGSVRVGRGSGDRHMVNNTAIADISSSSSGSGGSSPPAPDTVESRKRQRLNISNEQDHARMESILREQLDLEMYTKQKEVHTIAERLQHSEALLEVLESAIRLQQHAMPLSSDAADGFQSYFRRLNEPVSDASEHYGRQSFGSAGNLRERPRRAAAAASARLAEDYYDDIYAHNTDDDKAQPRASRGSRRRTPARTPRLATLASRLDLEQMNRVTDALDYISRHQATNADNSSNSSSSSSSDDDESWDGVSEPQSHVQLKGTSVLVQPAQESRFHVIRRVMLGNTSQLIDLQQRPPGKERCTHKWTLFIRSLSETDTPGNYIRKVRVFLHPSYRPDDIVDLTPPTFELTRWGWGEFPVRIQLFFCDKRNKPVDLVHMLKLDDSRSGISSETPIDLELDRRGFLGQGSTASAGQSQTPLSAMPPPPVNALLYDLMEVLCRLYPLVLSDAVPQNSQSDEPPAVSLPSAVTDKWTWGVAVSTEVWRYSWPVGKRLLSEYSRNQALLYLVLKALERVGLDAQSLTAQDSVKMAGDVYREVLIQGGADEATVNTVVDKVRSCEDAVAKQVVEVLRLWASGCRSRSFQQKGQRSLKQWLRKNGFVPLPVLNPDEQRFFLPDQAQVDPGDAEDDAGGRHVDSHNIFCNTCGLLVDNTYLNQDHTNSQTNHPVYCTKECASMAQLKQTTATSVNDVLNTLPQGWDTPDDEAGAVVLIDEADAVDRNTDSASRMRIEAIAELLRRYHVEQQNERDVGSDESYSAKDRGTAEPNKTGGDLCRLGGADDEAIDWVWSIVRPLELNCATAARLSVAGNSSALGTGMGDSAAQVCLPNSTDEALSEALDQRLVVGRLLLDATKLFLRDLVAASENTMRSNRAACPAATDHYPAGESRQPLLLTPLHVLAAVKRDPQKFDMCSNAYLASDS